MLQVSVLSLVLKVIFQDYVLEHLSITEQLDLFDDDTAEFKFAQNLYIAPKIARVLSTLPTLQSA